MAEWLAWQRAGGASKKTLGLRRYQLTRLQEAHPNVSPWSLTAVDLANWLGSHDWSAQTLRSYRSAMRGFYGWAHSMGLISVDPSRLLRKVACAPARPRPADDDVIALALAAADDRQWLMLMLGSRHGLRRGEIAQVHTRDLIRVDGGHDLLVHGKGGKDRTVPLLHEVAAAIRRLPAGYAFPSRETGRPITAGHVGVLLRPLLQPEGTTPHQLRHRFASKAYQRTLDIRAVQELLGHASVATTQIYTAVADDALRRAVAAAAA